MNKLFTKIAAVFLGVTMAVGVGVAVGTSTKAAEQVSAAATDGTAQLLFDNNSGGWAASTTASTAGPVSWKNSASNTFSNPTRIYSGNTFTISINTATASSINGVIIVANSSSYATATKNSTWGVNGSETSISTSVSSSTVTATTTGTVTEITIKAGAQVRWDSVTVYYEPTSSTDTYGLDGKNIIISSNNDAYIPSSIGTSGKPSVTTEKSESAIFLFTLVGNDAFTLKLTNGTNAGKYLKTGTGTGGDSTINMGTTSETWTIVTDINTNKYLRDADNHYLAANGTTDWRMYANNTSGYPKMSFEEPSTDPAITGVTVNGSPSTSANVVGGTQLTMSATVTVENDPQHTLSTNVTWSVLPENAVTFSKTTSASDEEITVTADNTNAPYNNVVITATSVADTNVSGNSNSFNVIKYYDVNRVTLSTTTPGGPNYDAGGSSSFVVGFNTTVIYNGATGTNKVNISVSPDSGVSGQGNNKDAGNFNLTFTKSDTYTVTSTSVENPNKSQSVEISISNIVLPGYEKITNASNLKNGSQIIIYSTYVVSNVTYSRVMSTTQNTNNRGFVSYSVSDNFIPESVVSPNNMEVLTLMSSIDGYWYLKTLNNKYLWADVQTASHNYLKSVDDTTSEGNIENTKFSITFSNGVPSVTPKVDTSRKIQHNHSGAASGMFSCYGGTQKDVELYLKIDTSPYFTINASTANIGLRGTFTVSVTAHNGARASIEWSTSDSSKVTIPDSSTGTSVIATGVGYGSSTIKAEFTALDEGVYEDLTCVITVVEIDDYVNIGLTKFEKVTTTPAGGWVGTYLIVDETSQTTICFDGSVSPLIADSTKEVSISNDTIIATTSMISSSFNIKASENSGHYNIRSNSGYYVGGADKGISLDIGQAFDITISSSGTITAADTSTLQFVSAGGYFRFYKNEVGNALTLFKADGEKRAITETLTDWYDNAKDNDYLVCDYDTSKSKIDWENLEDSAIEMLTSADLDTIKRMSARSSEDGGNYLEDFISDYDYLVQNKGYDDIFDRFKVGGAMYGTERINPTPILINISMNGIAVITIISVISVSAIGGYFFLRKRREEN